MDHYIQHFDKVFEYLKTAPLHLLIDQASIQKDFDKKHYYLNLLEYVLKTRQSQFLAGVFQEPSPLQLASYLTPTCVIVAGGKSVGKTTLVTIAPELFKNLERVSKTKVLPFSKNYRLKEEDNTIIELSKPYLEANKSFYVETSLNKSKAFYQEFIDLLKSYHYTIHLYFIDTYDTEEIYFRSMESKQSIDQDKLYVELEDNHDRVFQIMNQADFHLVFDNTEKFEIIQSKWSKVNF